MSHPRSANDDRNANLSDVLLDLLRDESSGKEDDLLEELTSEELFPGLADMIQEIVSSPPEE